MDISISILNYNTKNLLKQCIKNIVASDIPFNYEIIITDNASEDNSLEFIKKEILPVFNNVRLVVSKKNLGYGKGNNLGLRRATGKYIIIINPDIIVLGDAIKKLYNFMESNPKCGIAGPRLLYADLSLQRSMHAWPKLLTPLFRRTALGKTVWGTMELQRYNLNGRNFSIKQKVDWLIGASLIIRKSLWDTIAGFDKRYFLYYEDIDICKTIYKNGYEVWYLPQVRMIHYHKRLSANHKWWQAFFNKTARIHLKSHLTYFKKWGI